MSEVLCKVTRESFCAALDAGHILPYYQPVVRSVSRKLCSFEALARWVDPRRGLISPNEFIPVLEEARVIHMLDIEVIRQVCAQIRQTMDAGRTPVPISVNLSRLDFVLCDIFDEVLRLVGEYQIPHDLLYIEITESLIAEQGGGMHEVIDRFRSAGFQVWMDDFGSGYSSLNVLKDFLFDEIKMDMQFLSSFDQRSRRIMTSVIQMAKEIGIHTLAEGVETEEQFEYLRDVGCEKVQGYFFGCPLPYRDALEHAERLGIELEVPLERSYYDSIGKVDFLSAVPFMTQQEKDSLASARQLNSIPLAMGEVREERFSVLFYNTEFERTAGGTDLLANMFSAEMLRKPQPFDLLPSSMKNLMDSTRSGETGRMYFISGEEYYEIQATCVAKMRGAYCVLMRLNNLSKASESYRRDHLDKGLRQIYALYERIVLMDMERDRIEPLYFATREDMVSGRTGIAKLCEEYAERWVFFEDRRKYLEFFDTATLEKRLVASGRLSITKAFRTQVGHGQHEWKTYTILHLRPYVYMGLIRNVHEEVGDLLDRSQHSSTGFLAQRTSQEVLEERVWRALVDSGVIHMFWKDRERRFVGVSTGFLDYYGFDSADDVRGKTDEDLGWHVRPSSYMTDELHVLREGVVTHYEPGFCIRHGENRDIFASKAPVYDRDGHIEGLVGFFIDREMLTTNDSRGAETKRRDILTGLLNSRGVHEEAQLFCDEYQLRGDDFLRLDVGIDDMDAINSQYGFDFGDKVIAELGRALKRTFGKTSAVGRISGQQFTVMHQVRNKGDVAGLLATARECAEQIRQVDGTPLTLYISVGACLFSETENLEEQAKKAEVRLLADQDEHTSATNRQTRAAEIFHLYDNLPISYSVYKVLLDERGEAHDAIVFYVNHAFEKSSGRTAGELLGKSMRKVFPALEDGWYELLRRAAYDAEIIVDTVYFEPLGHNCSITASQVIHSGYCCLTFQQAD